MSKEEGLDPNVKPCGRGKVHDKSHPLCNCGRPTKYLGDDIMIAKVDEYLATCVDEYDPETKQRTVRLPKLESFALMLDISLETLNQWEKEHKKFSEALGKIRIKQKERLADEGLAGNYNPVIAKLHLASNHGMADKVDQDIKSGGEKLHMVDKETKKKVDVLLNEFLNSGVEKKDD